MTNSSKQRIAILACLLALGAATARALEEIAGTENLPSVSTHWLADPPAGHGAGPVTDAMLRASGSDSSHWLQYHGDYRGLRHSPIQSLTRENVHRLQVAWLFPTGTRGQFSTSPVVYDGVLYATTSYNRLFALDAAGGQVLWRYDHPLPDDLRICCGPANRGVAIGGNLVVMATLDAQLLAFDRRTGQRIWQTRIANYQAGYSTTAAPLIVDGRVFVGVGGSEYGIRGFFDAYELATGKRLWRHYTIPSEGEPGVETWAGDSWKHGGASTYSTGIYDVETDTLFWTAANPAPNWNGSVRQGDNLYSNSVIAVDPATGARKWYFQFTPHDVWDWGANSHLFLLDLPWQGSIVKALVTPNRNGFLYLLDRRDGRFLRATPYLDQVNWAKRIDRNGRPVVDPSRIPGDEPSERVCPGSLGGTNGAWAASFDPARGRIFVGAVEACLKFQSAPAVYIEGMPYLGGIPIPVDMNADRSYAHVLGIDVASGERRWERRMPTKGGTLTTAGGLVFTGNLDGLALALDADTGDVLWQFRIGSGIRSQPIAWEIDGQPYVAIGGGRLAGTSRWAGGREQVPDGGVLAVFTLPTEGTPAR